MSEPEVQNVANFLKQNENDIKVYISLHNYGQWWTYPYAHTHKVYQREIASVRELAELAATSLQNVHGNNYTVSSLADLMSKPTGSGLSNDWVVENTNIRFAYLIEVRPTMDQGHFCLDDSEIQPAGEELFEAFKIIAKYTIGDLKLSGKYEKYYEKLRNSTDMFPTYNRTTKICNAFSINFYIFICFIVTLNVNRISNVFSAICVV